jgi:hypothetical protein
MKSEYALSQDGYGTYARASHLADALEHICLCKGKSPTQAEVLDWIEDATWTLASDEAIETPSASIANDDPAARVFGLLAERQSVLGSHYPFEARDNRIYRIASKPDALRQPYSVLLAIAIAHSYALCPEPDPTRVFEAYVAAALGDHGLAVVDTGNTRRGMSDFESTKRVRPSSNASVANYGSPSAQKPRPIGAARRKRVSTPWRCYRGEITASAAGYSSARRLVERATHGSTRLAGQLTASGSAP